MNKYLILFLLMCALVAAGCSPRDRSEAIFYATQNAEFGVVPPPKYQTLAAEYYGLVLTPTPMGTATQNPNYTPTPNAFQYAQTADAMIRNNQMTAQAQQQQFELDKLKAEQAAEQARIVAQQHADQLTAQAREVYMQATAQAEATKVFNTQVAQATATERAIVMSGQATGTAAVLTAVVQPTHDLLTLQAARIQQTVEAGEAEKVELAVKRQSARNYFDAFLPWTIIIGLVYGFGRGFATYVKTRSHPRDEHGRPQTFTRELEDGGVVMVKPEQLESGIVKISGKGEVVRYSPMNETEQSDINRRAQAVEAIAALPMPYAQQGPKMLGAEFGRSTPRVNFRDDMSMSPVLDEADSKFLEGSDE